ncbi:hypothetical protein LOC68_05120 [Blastopirellula sp. JC732]|uniref:Uncharacterized protein n=1 Tax=Blastopirellula sediminis TaxID=2894196 RepID=A0A9X1MK44_9BACT|nr:hypothetical protein [Blastopirellula sediminis]MCC9609456.1 hypothetical protein [Blastopirellula sediminis]MCC9627767.1 hypothetical protein [Blastopirellula sediminis]
MSRTPILALILLMSIGDAAHAGCWLTDWLHGNQAPAQPVVTTNYAPAACPTPQPYQVNYVQPPAPMTCAPVFQNQTSVRYIPETQYTTTYKPVPVTVYQPTTVYLPGSNVPTLAYNGCTTYRWETERVPFTTYKPVIQNVQTQVNSCATVGYMQAAPAMQAAPPAVVGSCNSCGGAPAQFSAPIQSMPSTQGQWVPAQGGGVSSMVNPPGAYPQGMSQPMPSTQYEVAPYQGQSAPYQGGSPADQPPSLSPGTMTQPNYDSQNALRVAPEGNSVLSPTPGATIIKPSPQPSPATSPSATTPSTDSSSMMRLSPSVTPGTTTPTAPQSLGSAFTPYAPSSAPANQTPPTTLARPQLNPLIKPIPDPDYFPTRTDSYEQAPALLNPNDKSALIPTAKIVPIAWDEVAKPVAREVSYETPTVSIPAKKSSWHQIGR